jgi:hypothetical protein
MLPYSQYKERKKSSYATLFPHDTLTNDLLLHGEESMRSGTNEHPSIGVKYNREGLIKQ